MRDVEVLLGMHVPSAVDVVRTPRLELRKEFLHSRQELRATAFQGLDDRFGSHETHDEIPKQTVFL